MITGTLDVSPETFAEETGWEIKPEGACRGHQCVPLGGDGPFDVRSAADKLGMAMVHDVDAGVWAIGPDTVGGRALATAEAAELVLPTIDGDEFRLSSLRGRKVVIVSWAPY
jgi:hypothetical protein